MNDRIQSEMHEENIDPVTQLPNENIFIRDLSGIIKNNTNTVSLKAGIGGFSYVNKKHGFAYGNRILQETAFMMQEVLQNRGTLYRFKGSAFGILSDTMDRDELSAIYDTIRYRLQRGIQVNGIRNILTANGGMVSTFGSDADSSGVLACLNYAYRESKQHRNGELVDFNGSIKYDGSDSLELISTIRDSIGDGCKGFHMEYIPIFDAGTETIIGAESTLYWKDEAHGRIDPEDFMPILSRDFIFEELGDFILENSLRDGMEFLKSSPNFVLYINVYNIQLISGYFIENLTYFLEKTGFPPALLSVKLTADCRYLDLKTLNDIIETLHKHRIMVIIDGFGSGTNSIVCLKNTPVDAVCLDAQFMNGIEKIGRDRDILEYLTRMAATCVDHIIIPGVKDRTAREALRDIPATAMQGSAFSRPLPCIGLISTYLGA